MLLLPCLGVLCMRRRRSSHLCACHMNRDAVVCALKEAVEHMQRVLSVCACVGCRYLFVQKGVVVAALDWLACLG